MIKIYIGNLTRDVKENTVKQLFERFGPVLSVDIVRNKNNGDSWGYGFITMAQNEDGLAAIRALNRSEQRGRELKVEQARQLAGRHRSSKPSYRC